MFDKVIMNPPYSIGGKIWDKARKVSENIVCLMPLSKYKGNRCKYIDTYTLTGGDGFDADINENLGITICTNTFHKDYTYSTFEIDSYNPKYYVFFKRNLSMNKTIKKYSQSSSKKKNEKLDRNSTLVWNRRTVASTFTTKKNSEFMKWNNKEGAPMDSDIFIKNTRPNEWRAAIIWFNLPSERDNFWKWCSKGVLGDRLLKALNKSDGSFEDAIPRIDWETISDHPLWKEGKYDEAVLDSMGLKWEGERIVEI